MILVQKNSQALGTHLEFRIGEEFLLSVKKKTEGSDQENCSSDFSEKRGQRVGDPGDQERREDGEEDAGPGK